MTGYETIVSEISRLNKTAGLPELTRPVEIILSDQEKPVQIAFLGQFKSGKSSLINSLLQEEVLPVGVVPVTAIVTRVRYGPIPRLTVLFLDGSEVGTSLNELPVYVTEKLNPENYRKVSLAIIDHPALKPFPNINLIDTPGLNSIHWQNSETTRQWLPFVGVAVITVSAERPLSEEDLNLINSTSALCPDVILAITKTDLFKPAEIAEIRTHITESVKKFIHRELPVFEFSIFKNTRKLMAELFARVLGPLNLNYESKFNEIVRLKIKGILYQSIQFVKLALQAALEREQEKDTVAKALEDILRNRQYQERELLLAGSSFKGTIRSRLDAAILPVATSISEKLSTQFIRQYPVWEGSLFQVSRQYERWLKEQLGTEIRLIDEDCAPLAHEIVKEAAAYFQYSARRFREQLDEKLLSVFGVELPDSNWQIDFTGIDYPDISIYWAFDTNLDMILFFLPMKWFRKLFHRHFFKQIPLETEKNLYRLVSDLTGKIIKGIDELQSQTRRYIVNEISTVETVLQQNNSDCSGLRTILQNLEDIKLPEQ